MISKKVLQEILSNSLEKQKIERAKKIKEFEINNKKFLELVEKQLKEAAERMDKRCLIIQIGDFKDFNLHNVYFSLYMQENGFLVQNYTEHIGSIPSVIISW